MRLRSDRHHPTDGVLRRLVDEPAGVADADRAHVATCPACLAGLEAVRADARVAGAALGASPRVAAPAGVDVDTAWARLASAGPAGRAAAPARRGRWVAGLRRPAVAALGVVLVLSGAGVAAANDWLPIFRTERVAPVAVTETDLVALPDLSAFGDLEVTGEPEPSAVPDAATAEERSGLVLPEVGELPTGVTGDPTYQVVDQVSAVFTFSAAKAAQAAAATGEALPTPPPGLDGSSVRLQAGPAAAAVWVQPSGVPVLAVGRAVAPTASSDGVPFETVRDYLLSLPGLPADVAAQLRAFTEEPTTLPLPVPADLVTTAETEVAGQPATVLASRDGTMAGVVWVEDGVVTGVAGAVSTDEVLAVARGLR
ncbi:hypothetical protein DQ238_04960 [Geodermatophilus sp. TF02-6]|uniref:hypothetical protein n=1 Tax=Geodermatophilus sp. TF02-6 TaxID=2250575 RepID=UPI000DEAFE02|nr:hypothetical protein [Geodermatophilus sp. TF02-6]RBY81976.1 hypothetical protein DQ238_04960 [Geodermatophilus sp. TF02-6]